MSYILEALRKSQQERELGYVPTLQTLTLSTEEEGARPSLWILLAVILAALAVVIALYSALRGGAGVSEPIETVGQGTQAAVPGKAGQEPAKSMDAPPLAGSPRPAPTSSDPRRPASMPSVPEPAKPEPTAPAIVMDAPAAPPPPVRETPAATQPLAAPANATGDKVPADLIADIEAFKREVRDEQSETVSAAKTEETVPPQDLRLPKDVRGRLPEFIMSAHIYDKEPTKRFVLINGLKTREGEESREDITVEQILPDGAVLSFDGHRFFQRR